MAGMTFAQSSVRIGNMEISVKKINGDTLTQVLVDEPCSPCRSENETGEKSTRYSHWTYTGFGMNYPGSSADIYPLSGSFNFDVGGFSSFRLSRHFAFLGSFGYSLYSFRLRNVIGADAEFDPITGGLPADRVKKQMYRSNNLTAGIYTRFYLIAPQQYSHKESLYIDLGVQGEWAFAKYVKLRYNGGGSEKFHDNYAFKPFNASAVARIGWNGIACFARYRFTDAFNHNVLSSEMPRLSFGVLLN
ncbi:hypothetical protein FACS189464_0450 [Bacteroidia bacterium]|nr:hypothetical protein FACS189430_01720 [Bacteroidia bacterium]GHT77910.1 hypothetical protein FACS189464_0450 [Bacteroidia bacterium]